MIGLDTIFDNIHLYSTLQEIEDMIAADLHRRSISQVICHPLTDRPITMDATDFVTTRELRGQLVADPRCPEWLRREIVWAELKRPNS